MSAACGSSQSKRRSLDEDHADDRPEKEEEQQRMSGLLRGVFGGGKKAKTDEASTAAAAGAAPIITQEPEQGGASPSVVIWPPETKLTKQFLIKPVGIDDEFVETAYARLREHEVGTVGAVVGLSEDKLENKIKLSTGSVSAILRFIEGQNKLASLHAPPISSLSADPFPTFEAFEILLRGFSITPETDLYGPAGKQKEMLGLFYKDGDENRFPITRRGAAFRLDFELADSVIGKVRPAAEALMKRISECDTTFFNLLAVSGGGKTSSFADVAKRHFVLYVQCTPFSDKTNPRRSKGYDSGFIDMLGAMRSVLSRNKDHNATEAERLFMVEILCRLSQLFMLVQTKQDLTPFEFYIHQRNVQDEWLTRIRRHARGLSADNCKEFFGTMCEKLDPHLASCDRAQLVIAIDEIEAAAGELVGEFDDDSSKKKGILSPILGGLSELTVRGKFRVMLAGTGSSLKRHATIKSAVNKLGDLEMIQSIPKIFPTVSLDTCLRFFSKVNMDGALSLDQLSDEESFDPAFSIEAMIAEDTPVEKVIRYFVIGSRFRTMTRILQNIAQMDSEDKNTPERKRLALKEAVLGSINSFRDDLMARIKQTVDDRDSDQTVMDQFCGYLTTIWSALCLNGGEARVLSSTSERDLMMLGIGNFSNEFKEDHYRVNEYLVGETIRAFLEQAVDKMEKSRFRSALAAFSKVVETHGNVPARGTLLEHLVFQALLQKRFQGVVVSELPFVQLFAEDRRKRKLAAANEGPRTRSRNATEAVTSSSTGDPWWERAIFKANDIQYHHQMEDTVSFLASESALSVVYSPETVARFDGVVLLQKERAMSLALTIWNGSVPSEKIRSQVGSTDMSLAYYLADGTGPNPNCKSQRQAWEQHDLDKIRCVRVHLALPTFNERTVRNIQPPDELCVHLDQSNCHLLFGEGEAQHDALYDLLAIATNTDRATWPARRAH